MAAPATTPVVDLRFLSQSDISHLAAGTSPASDLRSPKIDRSVFNESAGSRKQTYSRLRPTTNTTDSGTGVTEDATDDDPGRQENLLIVSHLHRLLLAQERPPETLIDAPDNPSPSGRDLWRELDVEVVNSKGEVVDLVALGGKVDPFGEELKRRTSGLSTDEQLLEFMGGLGGQWGSRRRRRRVVDAAGFGDHLPKGWKLLLALKRKDGDVWINCRRYVSPSGKQFLSCKEVSLFIASLLGLPTPVPPISVQDNRSTLGMEKISQNDQLADAADQENNEKKETCSSVPPIGNGPMGHEKQVVLDRNSDKTVTEYYIPECKKCNLTFSDKDAYMQHQLMYHQRSAKRRKVGKLIAEGVIFKDGKYECQFCHKTFSERHRYYGHVGAHVRYQGLTAEVVPDDLTSKMIYNLSPMSAVPYSSSEMIVTSEQREEPMAEKPLDEVELSSTSRVEHNIEQREPFSENFVNEVDPNFSCRIGRDNIESREETLVEKSVNEVNLTSRYKVDDQGQREHLIGKSARELHLTSSYGLKRDDQEQDHKAKSRDLGSIDIPSMEKLGNDMIGGYDVLVKKSEDVVQSSSLMNEKSISPLGYEVTDVYMNDISQDNCVEKYAHGQLSDEFMTENNFDNISISAYVKDAKPDNNKDLDCSMDDCNLKGDFEVNKNSDTACLDMLYDSVDDVLDTENRESIEFYQSSFINRSPSANIENFDNNVSGPANVIMVKTAIGKESKDSNNSHYTPLVNTKSNLQRPLEINVSSGTLTSETEQHCEEQNLDSISQLIALTGTESSFTIESYSADILNGTLEANILDEMNAPKENDFSGSHSYLSKTTPTNSTMLDEFNANCTNIAFIDTHSTGTARNDPSTFNFFMKESSREEIVGSYNLLDTCFTDSKFDDEMDAGEGHITATENNTASRSDFIMKESAFDEMNRPSNLLDTCFPQNGIGLEEDDASNSMKNALQVDLTLTSPWLHSYDKLPMADSIATQQSAGVRAVGQKHENIPGFQQLDAAEPFELFGLSAQSTIPAPGRPVGLDPITQLGDVGCSSIQLGWGLPMSNNACQMNLVCAWCSREFSMQGYNNLEDTDSLGFLCPTCKARISSFSLS